MLYCVCCGGSIPFFKGPICIEPKYHENYTDYVVGEILYGGRILGILFGICCRGRVPSSAGPICMTAKY
jgi:hypothetical protein